MDIYRIFNPNREYKTIQYSDTPLFENIGKTIWDNTDSISSFPFTWDKSNKSKQICDCPFIIGSIPVFSKAAYETFSSYLNNENSQIIPIKVDSESYIIVNAIILIDDILNKNKSKISYFSDGRIMDIEKYVLNNKKTLPDIFKISQFQNYTFISEKIASIINAVDMTGIALERCKSNTFFPFL